MLRKLLIFAPLLLLFGCNTRTTIANNMSERDANEVVVLLYSKGIGAQKIPAAVSTTGGTGGAKMWDITVPARQITDALAILNQSGLPRVKGTSLLDLFGQQGLVPSEMQNKIRYQEGLSMQLANTIRTMDGIIDANVQITFPSEEDEERQSVTASVYVKHRGILDNPNSLLVTKIKRLVSSAIPGLAIDDVSVVSDRALYSDISLDQLQKGEDLQYVMVWGIVVAKGSVTAFRTILYTLLILLFLVACFAVWVIWKTRHIITHDGWRSFFHPDSYKFEPVKSEEGLKEEETPAGGEV